MDKNTPLLTLEECVDKYGPVMGPKKYLDQFPDWPWPDKNDQLDHSLDADEYE